MSIGSFDKNDDNEAMSEINTTPLVDVMLVLLIIFIVTAPLITNTVNVNLPSTKSAATVEKPSVINISLNEKGQLFLNNKSINQNDLPRLLEEAKKNKSEIEIHLQADRATRYEKITEIMTQAQKAGISKLGFVSKIEK